MSTIQLTNQVLYNLQSYLDRLFIQNGYYYPVSVGELDPDGNDMSELSGQTGLSDYADYEVWQSAFKPWVFEENISVPSGSLPITYPSGVYIDGTYTSGSGIHYDYAGGRVVFDSALAGTETVQVAGMTFKQISVNFASDEMFSLDQTAIKNQVVTDDYASFPSNLVIQPPAIYIEWFRGNARGWQLGGGKIHTVKIFIHIFAEDMFQLNDITDLIGRLEHSGIQMVDWNSTPNRFDVYGDKDTGFVDYVTMQSLYKYKTLYFQSIDIKNVPIEGSLHRSLAELTCQVIIPEPSI